MDVWTKRRDAPPVGQTASRSRQVTRRDIELFTEISGDRNPSHYDDELAAVAEDLPGPGSAFRGWACASWLRCASATTRT